MYIIASPSISAQTGQTRKSGITCPWPLDPTSPDLFGAFDLLIVSFGSFWIRCASAECSQYPKLSALPGTEEFLASGTRHVLSKSHRTSLEHFWIQHFLIQVTSHTAISTILHAFFTTAASTDRRCGHRASFHGLLLHCTSLDLPLSPRFFRYLIRCNRIHRAMQAKSKTKSFIGQPSTQ